MDDNLKKFAEKLKNAKSCYGAGGMQKRKNPNRWRKDLATFFEINAVRLVNPVEDNKEIFNASMMGFKEENIPYTLEELLDIDPEKRAMLFRQTELNDFKFMEMVDFQIFYLDESIGFGTMSEFRENYDRIKKPSIIIRTIEIRDLAHWVEWRHFRMLKEGNAIEFKNFPEMKKFFIEYLNYKEK
jgi:hypothetical protein